MIKFVQKNCSLGSFIFFDRVVREVNERAAGKGVGLRDGNGVGWEIKQVLYVDDTVLVKETREHLRHILNKFERERACSSIELKINVYKGKQC